MTERDIRAVLDWMDAPAGKWRPCRVRGSLQRRIMTALLSNVRPLSLFDIADIVWADRSDGGGAIRTLIRSLGRLRQNLAGSGYEIRNIHGFGYLLTPVDGL